MASFGTLAPGQQDPEDELFNIGDLSGQNIYENAAHEMLGRAPRDKNEGYPISSQYLRNKGIAGVKYGSGTIHKAFQGHTNYATFDPPRILRRYAIPGALGTGLAASMLSRQGQDNGT
jgi:hypothetical protein